MADRERPMGRREGECERNPGIIKGRKQLLIEVYSDGVVRKEW